MIVVFLLEMSAWAGIGQRLLFIQLSTATPNGEVGDYE